MKTFLPTLFLLLGLVYQTLAQVNEPQDAPCDLNVFLLDTLPSTVMNTTQIPELAGDWSLQTEEDLMALEGPMLRERREAFTDRMIYKVFLLRTGAILLDDRIQVLVDSLTQRLLGANDIINADRIRFLLYRSTSPNASCLGDGTMLINLGLLTRLRSTEQLAFVMAHELAHYQLDHVNQSIFRNVAFRSSKLTKKKVRATGKNKTEANEEYKEWVADYRVNTNKHGRHKELLTDSLGMVYFLNAGFTPSAVLSTLDMLGEVDSIRYPLPPLQNFFDFPSYPWQAQWANSDLSKDSLSEQQKEALRTHPEIEQRINQALQLLPQNTTTGWSSDLCEWHQMLELDLLEYNFKSGRYFSSLLRSLKILGQNPNHSYAEAILAHTLVDLCAVKKKRKFANIVKAPHAEMREDILRLATFLNNLSYSELKTIALYWNRATSLKIGEEDIKQGLQLKLEALSNDFTKVPKGAKAFAKQWPHSRFYRPIKIK